MTKIDLHVHSTCSDGLFSPEEVVRKAAAGGVTLLALADFARMSFKKFAPPSGRYSTEGMGVRRRMCSSSAPMII